MKASVIECDRCHTTVRADNKEAAKWTQFTAQKGAKIQQLDLCPNDSYSLKWWLDGKPAEALDEPIVAKGQQCEALIWHGPGHQSRTKCQVQSPHDVHEAIYGSQRQEAIWRGEEAHSGFFDEPPQWEED